MRLTLPWPPSVNHYWRTWRGRMLISRRGRAYREQVGAILRAAGVTPLAGPLAVHVELYPPDRRKRDVDNSLKVEAPLNRERSVNTETALGRCK